MAIVRAKFNGNPGAFVVDACLNPADTTEGYILWSDGKISYRGNPPSLEGSRPFWDNTGLHPARAIKIHNWFNGQGYILDSTGILHALNGATAIGAPASVAVGYADFDVDPANPPRGYRMTRAGRLYNFGGQPAPPAPLLNLNPPNARRVVVAWDEPGNPYVILDGNGTIHPMPGSNIRAGTNADAGPRVPNVARDLLFVDTDGTYRGYILDGYGGLHGWWTAPEAAPQSIALGGPDFGTVDTARVLLFINGINSIGIITHTGWILVFQPRTPNYLVAVGGPVGAQSTRLPVVGWVVTANNPDTAAADRMQVRIYRNDQYNDPGWNNSMPPIMDSGIRIKTQRLGQASYWPLKDPLGNGTFKALVRAGKIQNDGEEIDWSRWEFGPAFSVSGAPEAPINITPARGSTVDTDIPTLGARLLPEPQGALVKAEFQVAQDSAFGSELRTIIEPDADLRASGNTTKQIPEGLALHQGIWFVRARGVSRFGDVSPWSDEAPPPGEETANFGPNRFTVSHPPGTANWSPTGNQARAFGNAGAVELDWDFSDSSPIDSQTAYQVIVEENALGTAVLDSGKTVSTDTDANVTIPVENMDMELRWRVRVWDRDDVAGPWSPNQIFRVMEAADVEITSPGETVETPQPTFTWTFAATGSRIQALYRLNIVNSDSGALVYDSGQLQGAATSLQLPRPLLQNGETYLCTLTVWDNNGLSSSVQLLTTAVWTPPEAPPSVVLDASNFEFGGYVSIGWDGSQPDTDFSTWRIYRRVENDALWVWVDDTTDETYLDYLAPANEPLEYAVVQVAIRFDVEVESGYVPYSITAVGTHYFLIYKDGPTYNVRLAHVTGDNYTDEFEEETLKLIGRGRKVDKGTHWGASGELKAEIRDMHDGTTARVQKKKVEALQALRVQVHLRNPFGDVYLVSANNIQVGRLAGMGVREYVDLTIPYQEVR